MIAIADKLTSAVYGPDNAPVDWQDGVFLVPHEMIRRETTAFVESVGALTDSSKPWMLTNLSKWYIEYYFDAVMERKYSTYPRAIHRTLDTMPHQLVD